MAESERDDIIDRMADAAGDLARALTKKLDMVGNYLAAREKYEDLNGIEAVYFYLMNRHHWLPGQIRAMTLEDLDFAVSDVKVPPPRRQVVLPANARSARGR